MILRLLVELEDNYYKSPSYWHTGFIIDTCEQIPEVPDE